MLLLFGYYLFFAGKETAQGKYKRKMVGNLGLIYKAVVFLCRSQGKRVEKDGGKGEGGPC